MGQQAIGMIVVAGDATAVKAAIDAGAATARSIGGEAVSVDVISRSREDPEVVRTTGSETADVAASNDRDNSLEQAALAFGSPRAQNGAMLPVAADPEIERLFHSLEAKAIKEEICAVGRKLWQRSYVDGNGGNSSCHSTPYINYMPPAARHRG